MAGRADLSAPTAATAEPLLAFELDRLFRSDRSPTELGNDFEYEPKRRGSSQPPLGGREWSRAIGTIWFVWFRRGLV